MREFWNNVYFGEQGTSEYYMANIEYPFFAYYLEGKGEKPKTGALMFDSGKRTWKHYAEGWPLIQRAETTPFYLHADGKVSQERPSTSGTVSYVSDIDNPVPYHMGIETSTSRNYMIDDQRFAAQRPDVICFESDPLQKEMQLSGEMEVELYVDISSTDADFIVKVIDVYPDNFTWMEELGIKRSDRPDLQIPRYPMGGYQLMVRGEVMRGKFRESFSEPKPFVPGERTKVKFTMPDVNHTFKPGHKLMVQIQSTWFPLVDRNPHTFCDIYTCDESAYVDATINIHCDTDAPSCVKLPVVK
jgi:putative CocE/NonD family hydrolase